MSASSQVEMSAFLDLVSRRSWAGGEGAGDDESHGIDRLEVVQRVPEGRLSQVKGAELTGLSARLVALRPTARSTRREIRSLMGTPEASHILGYIEMAVKADCPGALT